MDAGLQVYGGKFFQSLRDKGDKVFLGIPMAPPRYQIQKSTTVTSYQHTSNTRAAPAPAPSTATYYAGSGGGCFGAGSEVLVRDVTTGRFTRTRVASVQPGDVLAASGKSTARVRCVVRIALDANSKPLLRLSDGLQITPKHPVRVAGGQWCQPKDLPNAQRIHPAQLISTNEEDKEKYLVYNFVLDSAHVITVNGMECV